MPCLDTPRDPLHKSLHAGPDFDTMSDFSQQTDTDKYAVPKHIIPDGMAYQWVTCEVLGQPAYSRTADAERGGWRAVPAERHDGLYMPPGTKGPIIVDGMMLYEIPDRVHRIKRQLAARQAKQRVDDMNSQLIYAPPGTGPRDASRSTVPVVRRESGTTEIMVE
jgi:hypothetical protein